MNNNGIIPTVAVLMSTYNGENYIKQQLDSIFGQRDVKIKLVVRDDGSTDRTYEILNKIEEIELIKGNNVGCEASFHELLYHKIDADYYAFADQDDIWMEDKLSSAINNMNNHNSDLSVCNLQLIDANGKQMQILFKESDVRFYNDRMKKFALCNYHGCVQVWSKKLHTIIQSYKPSVIEPHDVWVNAIANLVSSTFIDITPHINYRLHGSNTSGYAQNEIDRIKKGVKLYLGKNHPYRDVLCKQLLEGYEMLIKDKKKKEVLYLVANYKNNLRIKMRLLFHDFISKNPFQYRMLYRLCIITNNF